jgi:hypothetical protein
MIYRVTRLEGSPALYTMPLLSSRLLPGIASTSCALFASTPNLGTSF